MSTPRLVKAFYERIWNAGDIQAAAELLDENFVFRGSLGSQTTGRQEFLNYVRSIRDALSDYHCEILECVTEGVRAFARMRFTGVHTGQFRHFAPTDLPVRWDGAALFRFEAKRIGALWVLGDLAALDRLLKGNERSRAAETGRGSSVS